MNPQIPPFLKSLRQVVVDASVAHGSMAQRVRHRLPDLEWLVLDQGEAFQKEEGQGQESLLYLKDYKGRFLRFCPGTSHYRCCGYRIIHIGENCPLNCSYCILKAYFQDQTLKVWANQEDLWTELDSELGRDSTRRFRVGTGEFTDSLALEPITGYSLDLVAFLGDYPNCCLELKSKIVDLSWMDAVKRADRVLPAWSLNAPGVVESDEQGVASLEERLAAARECVRSGFRICLHFDPILMYTGWEKGYGQLIEMIFDYVQAKDIAYCSLGSFRCMPELKPFIASHWPESSYIYQELITGLDGKLRLLRPLRVQQFRYLVHRLRRRGLDRQLYLCMESDEVWQAVFGYTPQDLGGLARHLQDQAFQSGGMSR